MLNPLKQFVIKPIISLKIIQKEIIITNSTFTLILTYICIFSLIKISTKNIYLVPNMIQSSSEILFNFINNMLLNTSGKKSSIFFPHIFSIFILILISNFLGMFPLNFSTTSHISITFALAITIFLLITIIGFIRHGINYLTILLPNATPILLSPLIFFIEILVYFSRPISLSIRLCANITAGHVVLKVISTLVIMSGLLGILPFFVLAILTGFEIIIAMLQAYIFSILTCVYLNDAINLH